MMNSTEEYEKRYQENIEEMTWKVYNSAEYGADICNRLNEQDEVLLDVSDKLENTDSILDKSIYTLRNMTWTGYVHNTLINTTDFVKNNVLSYTSNNSKLVNSSSSQREVHTIPTNGNGYDGDNVAIQSPSSNDNNYTRSDKGLEQLSSAIETLHNMSVDIGNKLESQASHVESITDRSSQLIDKALSLTIRTSKLVNNTNRLQSKFMGVFQFVDIETGLYLTVNGTSLVLSRATNLPSRFYCYAKENNLYGLKSEMFMKYIGTSIWGNIIVNADTCGSNEECYIDFNETTTGILMISRNWGSGGWIKRSNLADGDDSINRSIENITETTSSLSDKNNMIRFAAIVISLHID